MPKLTSSGSRYNDIEIASLFHDEESRLFFVKKGSDGGLFDVAENSEILRLMLEVSKVVVLLDGMGSREGFIAVIIYLREPIS